MNEVVSISVLSVFYENSFARPTIYSVYDLTFDTTSLSVVGSVPRIYFIFCEDVTKMMRCSFGSDRYSQPEHRTGFH